MAPVLLQPIERLLILILIPLPAIQSGIQKEFGQVGDAGSRIRPNLKLGVKHRTSNVEPPNGPPSMVHHDTLLASCSVIDAYDYSLPLTVRL